MTNHYQTPESLNLQSKDTSKFDTSGFEENTENTINEENENKGLFTVKSANKWMAQAKLRPIPKMLFSEFWYEGEICILFADTNLGKSILAVQISDSISKGKNIIDFELEAIPQKVLLFDFELSDKQFERRYSVNFENHYVFDDNLIRVEINPDAPIPDKISIEEYLINSLEKSIIETNAKVVIIDNITYLNTENEKAKDALPLMKHLKALKKKYNISILALAHTPKRDMTKPITKNDLQGSKMLMNFCDSSFAIGESNTDKNIRYIKQIKQRNTEHIYDSNNVIICHIEKPNNFLQFGFLNFGKEVDHLKEYTPKDLSEKIILVQELNKQGKSQREIAMELRISAGAVNKYLKL